MDEFIGIEEQRLRYSDGMIGLKADNGCYQPFVCNNGCYEPNMSNNGYNMRYMSVNIGYNHNMARYDHYQRYLNKVTGSKPMDLCNI